MKRLIVFLLGTSLNAQAVTFSSVYEGEQYRLAGFSLVQADEKPSDFYVLPNQFRIKRKVYNNPDGSYRIDPGARHQVQIDEETKKEYSVYTFRFDLYSPSQLDLLTAGAQLKVKVPGAVIQGMAAPCGMSLAVPGFEPGSVPGDGNRVSKANPDVPYVEYSISSTESGKCNSFDPLPTTVVVTYRVPMSREPLIAEALTSNIGISIPSMTMLFPYRYKDKFVITLNKKATLEQLQGLVDVAATIKVVKAAVHGKIDNIRRNLEVSGQFHMDCRSPAEVCNKYFEMAKTMIEARLVTYTPIKDQAKDLVVGDADKDASMFKVGLAVDYKSVRDDEVFTFDFSNIQYSSISAPAHFRAAKVPVDAIDPKVREKSEKLKGQAIP